MKRYLLMAYFEGDHALVVDGVSKLAKAEPSSFYLIVPATPPNTNKWTWSEQEAYEIAKRRLESMLTELKATGADITGDVLNFSEVGAVDEAMQKGTYDQVIIATPPDEVSRRPFSDFEATVKRYDAQVPIIHLVVPNTTPIERG